MCIMPCVKFLRMVLFLLTVTTGVEQQPPTSKVPPIFRPSTNSQLSNCFIHSLTAQQQRDVTNCFTECWHNPCCQAVNLTSCEQSPVRTDENMDFVKRGINWIHKTNYIIYHSVDSSILVLKSHSSLYTYYLGYEVQFTKALANICQLLQLRCPDDVVGDIVYILSNKCRRNCVKLHHKHLTSKHA